MAAKAVPDGYHTVTPQLIAKNAAKAIEFYKRAFGATEFAPEEMKRRFDASSREQPTA